MRGSCARTTGGTAARLAVALGLLAGCTAGGDDAAPTATTTTAPDPTTTTAAAPGPTPTADTTAPGGEPSEPSEPALDFDGIRLRQGDAASIASAAAVELLDGTPLDDAAIAGVVDRLPPLDIAAAETTAFSWPAETITRPQGEHTAIPFPAGEAVDVPPATPETLEVLRVQPTGDVGLAPFLSITFNQPMVPVGTVDQLAASEVPASITPAVEGRWQWIGTSTLRFDATDRDRLPMATDYTITVPAGTPSAGGAELAAAVDVAFSTPPAEVQGLTGDRRQDLSLQPVLVATFDQDIDAEAVLAAVTVAADGEERDVRVATADEIADDEAAQATVAAAVEGRFVAFTPVEPFTPDQVIQVTFPTGIRSAEGPALSAQEHRFSMRTYAPLRVTGVRCWQSPCRPGEGVEITFNNALDAGAFDPAAIGIEPAVGARTVGQYENVVSVQGAWLPNTTYQLTIPAGVTDVYGQTLGGPEIRDIEIGPARPLIRQFEDLVVTIDPSGEPALPVVTVGHEELRVTVWAADPATWFDSLTTLNRLLEDDGSVEPDWPVLREETVRLGGGPDAPVETSIDLADLMIDGHGQVIVRVESVREFGENDEDYWNNRPAVAWVQGTDLGVDVVTDSTSQHVWVTDLSTGTPIEGVTVGDTTTGATVTTDADGLAVIDLPGGLNGFGYAVTARSEGDLAVLPSYRVTEPGGPRALWHVVDDRGTYWPGETVRLKGWVRGLSAAGQLQAWDQSDVDYVAYDGFGVEVARGTAEIGPAGSFTLALDLPAGASTGIGWIALDEGEAWMTMHELTIAEYRRPDFEVTTSAGTGPYRRGESITATAQADYYTGSPLGDAAVTWQVTTSEATYDPPGWERFDFGRWMPWWSSNVSFEGEAFESFESEPCCGPDEAAKVETFTGRTDTAGAHYLDLRVGNLDADLDGLPVTVRANAAVQDVNRQVIAGTTDLLVHPADLYVGLGGTDTFVRQGEDLTIEVIVSNIDGAAVAGRQVEVVAGRTTERFVDGEWTDEVLDTTTCTVTSATEPAPCTLTPPSGGTYRITATVTDGTGRVSRSETTRWVSGAEALPSRTVRPEALTVVPDAEEYRPGQTAELFVQAPFASGTGLIVTDRGPVTSTATFDVVDGSAIVPVEIGEDDIPNVNVSIEVAGSTPRTAADGSVVDGAPERPAFATGAVTLPVSTASRTLDVTVAPADEQLAPGEATTLDVEVAAPDGAPVAGADLLVLVVDEAVLALSGYELDDPAASFYAALPSDVAATYGRDGIVLLDPLALLAGDAGAGDETTEGGADTTIEAGGDSADEMTSDMDAAAPAQGERSSGGAEQVVAVRSNFEAVALFAPDVTTDAAGRATVDLQLPDNLTRYRVMVVAAAGSRQFGTGEANATAALPLMVRPTAPRFLNFGDRVELPVVVQNDGDAPLDADVVVESANLGADVPVGVRVTVPANDRVEVRFPLAAEEVGRGVLRVSAVGGDLADSATVSLPVYTPSTSEAVATYGELDGGATLQPVLAPTDVIPQFGGLEVSTSSTTLQALTDAVLYLTEYRYASSDGLASQLLAISSLRDVLDAFDSPKLPSGDEIDAAMDGYIGELTAMQNDDGGFPYWLRGRRSEPFNTIQAAHALLVAHDAGYAVPADAIDRAVGVLGVIEQFFDPQLDEQARWTLRAYALHVRALAGQADPAAAQALYTDAGDGLPLDALAWLWPVIEDAEADAAIEQRLNGVAVDTAGAVTFTTGITDDGAAVTLASDRRTDGVILGALLAERPDSDLVAKVVRGLQAGQGADGRWDNVQENAFILLALRHYFDAFEGTDPDFVARVWIGERFAGAQEFAGRSTATNVISVPTADVIAAAVPAITIGHEGAGRLYYRIGLRTAPASLDVGALDRGFVVDRRYEAVDDPADVSRDADGTWRVRAGARVRVRLTLVAESPRTHVALVDPLPAGLEIVNPTLATSQEAP
ncbi:MAG: alpha-2-macroglobulin family protein, partial [Ilumatobacteraceae bacterium]